MSNAYKLTTVESNGAFIALAISADATHSFTVGKYATRREPRLALEEHMRRDETIEIVKRLNRKRELPDLRTVCTA